MTINDVPVYLIKYEWGDMPLEQLGPMIECITKKIQDIDPLAEWVAMPTSTSLEKIDINTLRYLYDGIGDYIATLEERYASLEQEEEN